MGAHDPIRSVLILPYMSIDLFFVVGAVSLSDRSGVVGFFATSLRQQLSSLEFVFCFFRCGLLFRDLTLTAGSARSSIGFAEWTRHTISSIASRGIHVNSDRCLFS